MAEFESAVDTLSPLVRAVFLAHVVDEMPYRQIAGCLMMDVMWVEVCMTYALTRVAAHVEGRDDRHAMPDSLVHAEILLLERYRSRSVFERFMSFERWLRSGAVAKAASRGWSRP